MKKNLKQKEIVRRCLRKGITTYEAFADYGITRLGAIIGFLEQDGMKIKHIRVSKKNKLGYIMNFVKYKIG